MLDILIVAGSLGEALEAAKAKGWPASHEACRDALTLHRRHARFATIHPKRRIATRPARRHAMSPSRTSASVCWSTGGSMSRK